MDVWWLWESPGADDSGKCLFKNMRCVEQDLPLVHGDLITSLTRLGLDLQNLGQVWLKGSVLHHRTSPPSWPCSGVVPLQECLQPKEDSCQSLLPSPLAACSRQLCLPRVWSADSTLGQDHGGSWLLKAVLSAFMGLNLCPIKPPAGCLAAELCFGAVSDVICQDRRCSLTYCWRSAWGWMTSCLPSITKATSCCFP